MKRKLKKKKRHKWSDDSLFNTQDCFKTTTTTKTKTKTKEKKRLDCKNRLNNNNNTDIMEEGLRDPIWV